jgi:hypothetical protein
MKKKNQIHAMLLARLLFGAFLLVIQRRLFSPHIILQIYRHSRTRNVLLVKQKYAEPTSTHGMWSNFNR